MSMEFDRRKKDGGGDGPSAGTMGETGKKGGEGGDKPTELKDISGPKIDRAAEQQKNADIFKQ